MGTVEASLVGSKHIWDARSTLATRGGVGGRPCTLRTRTTPRHDRVNLHSSHTHTHFPVLKSSGFYKILRNNSDFRIWAFWTCVGQGREGEHGWSCDRAEPGWRGRGGRWVVVSCRAGPQRVHRRPRASPESSRQPRNVQKRSGTPYSHIIARHRIRTKKSSNLIIKKIQVYIQ